MHPIVIVPGFLASSLQTHSKISVWQPTLFSLRYLSLDNELEAKGLASNYYSGLINFLQKKRIQKK